MALKIPQAQIGELDSFTINGFDRDLTMKIEFSIALRIGIDLTTGIGLVEA